MKSKINVTDTIKISTVSRAVATTTITTTGNDWLDDVVVILEVVRVVVSCARVPWGMLAWEVVTATGGRYCVVNLRPFQSSQIYLFIFY